MYAHQKIQLLKNANFEKELKYTLSKKADYDSVKNFLGSCKKSASFTNYFFDTENYELNENKSALRLRCDDKDFFQLTLKIKKEDAQNSHKKRAECANNRRKKIEGLFIHHEINVDIKKHLAELLLNNMGKISDLPGPISAILESPADNRLFLLGFFKCQRMTFALPENMSHYGGNIELDWAVYQNGAELFELEYEGENPEKMQNALENFLYGLKIEFKRSAITKYGILRKSLFSEK